MLMGAPSANRELVLALEQGRLKLEGPRALSEGRGAVDCIDTETGEVHTKVFPSVALATDWVASQLVGERAPTRTQRKLAVRKTGCATLDDPEEDDDGLTIAQGLANDAGLQRQGLPPQREKQQTRGQMDRFRIRPVRDVLESYGLDPTAEIAKALQATVPVMKDGVQVLDEHGEPLRRPVLDERTRTMVATELMQYVTPKLKAIETIIKDDTPRTAEEIDAKLVQLLERRQALADGAVR